MNETLGKITCPICGESADLRRCGRGARTWYWVCQCGKITPNLAGGQAWIMEHGRIFGREPPDPDDPAKDPVEDEQVPKGGWLDW